MNVSHIVSAMEAIAPPSLAADWDNVGLLVGDASAAAGKAMLCIDLTPAVLAEAVGAGAKMLIAYHPVIFKPVARVTAGATPIVYQALRRGMAVYSPHTALDAVPGGTNDVLADLLGLAGSQRSGKSDPARRPLEPSTPPGQCKIVVFVRPDNMSEVADAAFAAGAGRIGDYSRCAFFAHGIGTFMGAQGTNPAVGRAMQSEAVEEMRLEFVAPRAKVAGVCAAIRASHSYEEPAIDVYPLEGLPDGCGMGRVGQLVKPATAAELVKRVKRSLKLQRVMVTWATNEASAGDARLAATQRRLRRAASNTRAIRNSRQLGDSDSPGAQAIVSTAACCAGSAGSLFRDAIAAGAEFYLTGEMRHHNMLEAARGGMTVCCAGHSNSERPALAMLAARLRQTLPRLNVTISKADREPFEVL